MNFKINDITFVIVVYRSEEIIHKCLSSLPKECKKIIIENSNNTYLSKDLTSNYDNIEVILSENNGMGSGNNIGLKSCKTRLAYVINPDVHFKEDTLNILLQELNKYPDFTLASPLNSDKKIPNFKIFNPDNENYSDNIKSVDSIDGFSMIFNLEKFKNQIFFDENFFLFLENDDLCLRVKEKNEKIFIITNATIHHSGGIGKNDQLEYLRNWHWMWSKYYFNKKHYGTNTAIKKVFFNFISASLKYIIYSISFNKHMKKIYQMRLCGLIMSFLGKRSFLRPKD